MIEKTVLELKGMIDIVNDVARFDNVSIKGVSINSRTVEPGNLFIPLKGERTDGHKFVELALEQGATASLWQADIPNPPENVPILIVEDTVKALHELSRAYRNELNLKVAAVTGSNGKTTTKDMLAELLSLKYKVQKTIGNFNNHLGLPLTILSLRKDTEVAVLEMGMSEFGEIDFLTRLAKPDAAIITNIGEAHLQELGSREGIARAKLEILNGLQPGGLFVYPGEEPLIHEAMQNENRWKIKTFGKSKRSDVYPTEITMTETESVFQINVFDGTFRMPVLGEYNVMNAMAAMIVAHSWGVPFEQMNEAFRSLKLTQMRMEMADGLNGSKIINDAYNASPTSMIAVIRLAENLPGYKKKILVLGDMLELGPKEKEYHLNIGNAINHKSIHRVYTYGPLAKLIADGAKKHFDKEQVIAFDNKEDLIAKLKEDLEEGTLVVVKGSRGMKLEEVVETIKK